MTPREALKILVYNTSCNEGHETEGQPEAVEVLEDLIRRVEELPR